MDKGRDVSPPPLLVIVLDKLFGIQQYNDFPAPKRLSAYLLMYWGLGTLVTATQIFILRQS